MQTHPVFKGCTRPAMFMGVPYVPFFLGAGTCVVFAAWFNVLWLLAVIPVILVMRAMAAHDDMVFRLLAIRLQFWLKARNRALHGNMWVYTPNQYRPTKLNGK